MSDGTLLLILSVPAVLALAFGIWVGLGYPGMYEKYEKTGRASRVPPLKWLLLRGRRRSRGGSERDPHNASDARASDAEEEPENDPRDQNRPRFDRGRRIPR